MSGPEDNPEDERQPTKEDWEAYNAQCDRQEKVDFSRNFWTVVGLILLFLGLCVLWALIVNDRLIHLLYLCRP